MSYCNPSISKIHVKLSIKELLPQEETVVSVNPSSLGLLRANCLQIEVFGLCLLWAAQGDRSRGIDYLIEASQTSLTFFESYSVQAATLRYWNSPHPHEVRVKTTRSWRRVWRDLAKLSGGTQSRRSHPETWHLTTGRVWGHSRPVAHVSWGASFWG